MDKKLDLILSELKTVKEDIESVRSELKEDVKSVRNELHTEIGTLKTKIENIESNQLTFLNELREQQFENQTREKILLNEINKLHDSVKFVNRRVADVELEVDEVKRDLKEYRKINLG